MFVGDSLVMFGAGQRDCGSSIEVPSWGLDIRNNNNRDFDHDLLQRNINGQSIDWANDNEGITDYIDQERNPHNEIKPEEYSLNWDINKDEHEDINHTRHQRRYTEWDVETERDEKNGQRLYFQEMYNVNLNPPGIVSYGSKPQQYEDKYRHEYDKSAPHQTTLAYR